jgi:acetyl-CoA carboxylase biotin carboxyl carrier protein
MIDFTVVEKLLDLLNRSDAQSIEITKRFWSTSIRVSKTSLEPSSGPVTYQVAAQPAAAAPSPAAAPAAAAPAEPDAASEPEPASDLVDITSPMVGTFYARPEPDADPYVQVGGRINVGQTLCIIEAMKIMNPLDAEIAGVVKERLVEDAQPVEYGQVLFRVDPNG